MEHDSHVMFNSCNSGLFLHLEGGFIQTSSRGVKAVFPAGYSRVKINPSPVVFINSNTLVTAIYFC